MPCAIDGDAEHSARAVRQLERRAHEDRLPPRPRACATGASCRRSPACISTTRSPPRLWDALEDDQRSPSEPRQDFVSEQYFGVLRNYRRFGWLVLYLFGTSPAVSKSFFAGREIDLPTLDARHALRALRHLAAHERHRLPQQEPGDGQRLGQQPGRIRARPVAGDRHALSALREDRREGRRRIPAAQRQHPADRERVLQLHPAEARGALRASGRPRRCGAPGVEYVEVRALDVSAFDPVGVNQNKLRFLEAFLALCLLRDSEPIGRGEQEALDANHLRVARRGPRARAHAESRRPRVPDARMGARSCSTRCRVCASCWTTASRRVRMRRRWSSSAPRSRTSSARRRRACSPRCARPASRSSSWRCACPRCTRTIFWTCIRPTSVVWPSSPPAAQESHEEQARIEAADKMDFDTYLAHYLAD